MATVPPARVPARSPAEVPFTRRAVASVDVPELYLMRVHVPAAVAQSAGTAYSVLASVRQGALGMLVLCHGSLRPMVREVRTGSYLLSVKEMVNRATKGAVGVSVRMRGGVSALLVNSHLPAGETKWRERNSAYHKIKRNLLADMAAELHAKNATRVHDLTVWMGDLNYRVRSNRAAADRVLAMGMPEVLAGNDQLRQEQRHRRAYVHFTEGPLAFPPTYKFDLGTDQYDTSKKERVPSWTDRVLFKTGVTLSTENVRCERKCLHVCTACVHRSHGAL